jgi:tetratricopeptide (TPR) repeat protein
LRLGVIGFAPANKASVIYATGIEQDSDARLALLDQTVTRAVQAVEAMPEHANSHYLYAYALGRYSQGTSVLRALAEGFGSKIRNALDRTLKLEPEHAEAHIAYGAYHAEIVDKVGDFIGGLTYGASKEEALKHYRKAISLHPHSAIAHLEYGRGLVMLFGESKRPEGRALWLKAAKQKPVDAMERLDVEAARSMVTVI